MLDLLLLTLSLAPIDDPPEPEDVKAGWTAMLIFIGLALALAVLGFSLVKQLRKAQAARDAGVFDEPPDEQGPPSQG